MLVGERMKSPVITVRPDMSLIDALTLMKQEHIRRTPVVKDGKLDFSFPTPRLPAPRDDGGKKEPELVER